MKPQKASYSLVVTYNGFDSDFDRLIEATARRESSGSGCGFAQRDIDFEFATERGAQNTAKRLRKIKGARKNNLKTHVAKYTEL